MYNRLTTMSTPDHDNTYPSQPPEHEPSAEQLKLEAKLRELVQLITELWEEYTSIKYRISNDQSKQAEEDNLNDIGARLEATYRALKAGDDTLKQINSDPKDDKKIHYNDTISIEELELDDGGSEYLDKILYERVHDELGFFRTQFEKIVTLASSTDDSLDKSN